MHARARMCAPTRTIKGDVAAEAEVASSLIPAQSRGTFAPRSAQENNKSIIYLLLPPPHHPGEEAGPLPVNHWALQDHAQ